MNPASFYGKTHNLLPVAIEQISGSKRMKRIVALPPNQVDGETHEEQLDDDDLNNEEIPTECAGQIEIEDETDESDDDTPVVSRPNKKIKTSNPPLKWKKINQCCEMVSTAGAEERRSEVVARFAGQNPVQINI